MSQPKVSPCNNECGGYVYFDPKSDNGYGPRGNLRPLEYDKATREYTDQAHDCPKNPWKQRQQQQLQELEQEDNDNNNINKQTIPKAGPETPGQKAALLVPQIEQRLQTAYTKLDEIYTLTMKLQEVIADSIEMIKSEQDKKSAATRAAEDRLDDSDL